MVCKKCGNNINENSSICSFCGNNINNDIEVFNNSDNINQDSTQNSNLNANMNNNIQNNLSENNFLNQGQQYETLSSQNISSNENILSEGVTTNYNNIETNSVMNATPKKNITLISCVIGGIIIATIGMVLAINIFSKNNETNVDNDNPNESNLNQNVENNPNGNDVSDANYSYPTIPEGFVASDLENEDEVKEGLVIYEGTEQVSTDFDAKETRNQFVWVPVEYTKTNTDSDNNGLDDGFDKVFQRTTTFDGTITPPISFHSEPYSYDETITETNDLTGEYAEYKEMCKSVERNKGFYIARYEAGTTSQRTSISNGTTDLLIQKNKPAYDYVGWGVTETQVEGDVIFAEKNQGKSVVELSRKLYDNSSIKSHLIYGVQWDAALMFISKTDSKYAIDSTGKGQYTLDEETTKITDLLVIPTGSIEAYSVNNIYDMAGNNNEFTMEGNGQLRQVRGGYYSASGKTSPASSRISHGSKFNPQPQTTFRVALYLK